MTQSGATWFDYGRALLVRSATRASTEHNAETAPDATPDISDQDLDANVATTRQAFLDSLDGDGHLAVIAANAGLDVAGAEVLALLTTAESSPSCQRLVETLQGDASRSRLTVGAISDLLEPDHPGPITIASGSALRRSALVDIVQVGGWSDHVAALHPTFLWALAGANSPDPDLPIGTTSLSVDAPDDIDGSPLDAVVVVNGPDRHRRRTMGARRAGGGRFMCSPCPDGEAHWAAVVREATITGQGVVVELDADLPDVGRQWIERATHLRWVLSAVSGPPLDQMPERPWIDLYAPTMDPTDEEWVEAFGPGVPRTHRLTFDQMHRVSRGVRATGGDMDAAVRRLASGRLDQLTKRIRPTRRWADIVLSDDRLDVLHQMVHRYRHSTRVYDEWGFVPTPSRGLVALFSGPSGTGKTLAAEIIAAELELDLFKLDLSSVVSKFIGETEKNLERVFDAASAADVVLFFDEADSLFGKRSEVKDARDRYANIEVSYLLQRLESYDGLVIMATNFEKNIDDAFLRRIHVRLGFDLPGPGERETIWKQNFPSTAPVDNVDFEWLATRFELSGGMIRNAAIHAAFAAAAADEPITMRSAVLGVAGEFRKAGRLLRSSDFGDHFHLVEPVDD